MIRISVQLTLFIYLLLSVSKALFFSSFIEPVYECDLYFFLLPGDIIIPVLLFFFLRFYHPTLFF